jgi:GntR family histidine utilization transcriptional repressor
MNPRVSYKQVKNHVLEGIRSGQWRPGELIPKEQELADSFGCARMTVHRALRELAEAGLVERRRRSGTRVALQTSRNTTLEIPRVDREIEATGALYHYRRLSRRQIDADSMLRERLALSGRSRILHVCCLHFAGATPFQFEERWINLAAVPEALEQSFKSEPPNIWLLEHKPWSRVEHVIRATNASAAIASYLELSEGDAMLVIERRTWSEAQVLTFVRQSHPGHFYTLRTGSV